jgi:hypothetical protein
VTRPTSGMTPSLATATATLVRSGRRSTPASAVLPAGVQGEVWVGGCVCVCVCV